MFYMRSGKGEMHGGGLVRGGFQGPKLQVSVGTGQNDCRKEGGQAD